MRSSCFRHIMMSLLEILEFLAVIYINRNVLEISLDLFSVKNRGQP